MVNSKLLKELIDKSGLKLGFIAEKLGVSYHWLNKKMSGEVPFKDYEIQMLCNLLNVKSADDKERIFFARDVEESSTKEKQ